MSSVLPSGWLRMLSSTAFTPSAVTTLKTGSGPRSTRAKSLMRTGTPPATDTDDVLDLRDGVTRPSTTVRYSVWSSSCIPAGDTRLFCLSASVTCARPSPAACSFVGSTMTWYSGVRPPTRSTRATPGIRRNRGFRL